MNDNTITLPLIGLTSTRQLNRQGRPAISVSEAYIQAISQAGGLPVLIPLGLPEAALQGILSKLDGLLFTGGGDIHPQLYEGEDHPLVHEVDPDRDRVEMSLARQAVEIDMPMLGICRGLQVVNVALGGSLYEDITDQHPGAIRHAYYPDWPRDHLAHAVQVTSGSLLERITNHTTLQVNSLHHQGIRRLAPGLVPTAHSLDGIIEACELVGHNFGVCLQWHPECLPEHAAMRLLFRAFVNACKQKSYRQSA